MDVKKFIIALTELDKFLEAHDVSWRSNTQDYLTRLTEINAWNDRRKISVLSDIKKEMFQTGMGSLEDLYLSQYNGDDVTDEHEANAELDRLRSRLRSELYAILP